MITQKDLPAGLPKADSASQLLLGLDIGGTKTTVLLVDRSMQLLGQLTRPTITTSPEALVAAVMATIQETLTQASVSVAEIGVAGVAVPGFVEPDTGTVRLAVNLNLEAYPLGPTLAGLLDAPTYLENDVRSAALGAYRFVTQHEPLQHLAYLSIGTGISSGVILDGRLHRGAKGMAGEIGHVIFEPGGPICGCGMPGCLEALASGSAIGRLARERMGAATADVSSAGDAVDRSAIRRSAIRRSVTRRDDLTAEAVFEAARQGDDVAEGIIRQVSNYLARAILLLVMAYDVERVVLGGGVSQAGPILLNPIQAELAFYRSQSVMAAAMLPDNLISLLPAGYNAGAWGAIMKILENETDETKQS